MSAKLLLIEDEAGLVTTMSDLLTAKGFTVDSANDGLAGLAKVLSGRFDLVILDVMLPGMSGLDVCRELREQGNDVPVLMLTAKTQLADRVAGLRLGADDYLIKPFETPELLARIDALLRRLQKGRFTPVLSFQFDKIEINFATGEVRKDGVPIALSAKEMELLRYLVDRRGKIVSRDELLKAVWDYQPGVSSRTIDVHVAWLRQKLGDDLQTPRHIQTVRGVGYRFSP
ncbi:MAG: response regulator transcription factor [Acidobacteriia bacterium]|nr:response regulator transcription factor [Terriglobia bacterium]